MCSTVSPRVMKIRVTNSNKLGGQLYSTHVLLTSVQLGSETLEYWPITASCQHAASQQEKHHPALQCYYILHVLRWRYNYDRINDAEFATYEQFDLPPT